jgi:glutamate dehydrogenase (NAD(P)+)
MPVEADLSDDQTIYRVTRHGRTLGIIAVDSTVAGRARGGLRLVPDATEAEIRAAARAMTLKYGFLGFPHGGAKAGVVGDGEAPVERKREVLAVFADEAASLLRDETYLPDADLGTSATDIRAMLDGIGVSSSRHESRGESGFYTAVSVAASARALLAHHGRSVDGCRVAIEGFGNVGANVAFLLAEAGARIVAVSTARGALYRPEGLDVARLLELRATVGSRLVTADVAADRLPREELLELPVDLLCPCARHHTISERNVDQVRATLVCAGANDPVSPAAQHRLFDRGTHVLPDFVTNCGGVLGGTLEFFGADGPRIRDYVDAHLAAVVPPLLREATRRGVPVRAVAEPIALERHRAAKARAERPGTVARALAAALACYRRGWLPRRAVAPCAGWYLGRIGRLPASPGGSDG